MDENKQERIGIAPNGWKWMRMDANGRQWVRENGNEWNWARLLGNEYERMRTNETGRESMATAMTCEKWERMGIDQRGWECESVRTRWLGMDKRG
jgi:hypothetical protein